MLSNAQGEDDVTSQSTFGVLRSGENSVLETPSQRGWSPRCGHHHEVFQLTLSQNGAGLLFRYQVVVMIKSEACQQMKGGELRLINLLGSWDKFG